MGSRTLLALAGLGLLAVSPLIAEKVPMSPKELRATATHVVTGEVQAIYSRVVADEKWRTLHLVAEVLIQEVEKGEGLEKGGLVYARYWKREWIGEGKMPPGTGGHTGLPAEGQTLRIYLARSAYDGFTDDNKDGGYNVIGGNGFEEIK